MAFEDYDEYEQGEQVRKWIKENGIAVAVGVVLALALIFGWRKWQEHKTNHEVQAASQFAVVQNAVQADNKQAMAAALGDLQKNYADTTYAAFGSAAVAEYEVGKNDLKPATQALEWAVAHSKQPALKSLFSLRLARGQLAQDQPQQALTRWPRSRPATMPRWLRNLVATRSSNSASRMRRASPTMRRWPGSARTHRNAIRCR